MKLEILSLQEALNYVPQEKSGAIRIFDSIPQTPLPRLIESDNWVEINTYFFNDGWSKDWKEYSWVEDKEWDKLLEIERRDYPKMTKESLISYYESEGHPYGRGNLFREQDAKKILENYEKIKKDINNLIIHCRKGQNRSPAIGIAINKIYGLGIKGLKEKFPWHRKYVCDLMIKVYKEYF